MQKQKQGTRWARRVSRGLLATAAMVVGLGAASAQALPIEASVGTGLDEATVVLEFKDGAEFVFLVAFTDDGTVTGLDLLDILETELPSFMTDIQTFFGPFVNGLEYDGHANAGFGGGEDYWHYWTKDTELDPWAFSSIGVGDRLVSNGAWDGWVYGSAAPPVPEPGTAVLVGLGLAGLAGYRRSSSPVA